MKRKYSRYLSTTFIMLLMLMSFLIGYQANGNHAGTMTPVWASMIPTGKNDTLADSVSLRSFELFQQAFTTVQAEYVDSLTNTDEMTYAGIRGMLSAIHDPYTRFMDPKEYKAFNEQNEGRFVGIGATLNMTEFGGTPTKAEQDHPVICPVCKTNITELKFYRATVAKPLPGSPAEQAHLQAGDVILKVDDTDTTGMILDDVVDKIRGPEGTAVKLTLARKGSDTPIEVSITRAPIEVPAVESKTLDRPEGKIGYLHLLVFNEKTYQETREALMKFKSDHVKGVVLDLRNNPGGLLQECVKIASLMLPKEDKVIVYTKGRDRVRKDEMRIDGDPLYTGPMVVLVNKGSASASEILTGALKDYKRAQVIGETTFGKALVQTVIPLGDPLNPSAMPVTTARYYTPVTDFNLNKKGITPDMPVELDKDTKELNESDNQATAALGVLKDAIAK